jgi:hypothetical protein
MRERNDNIGGLHGFRITNVNFYASALTTVYYFEAALDPQLATLDPPSSLPVQGFEEVGAILSVARRQIDGGLKLLALPRPVSAAPASVRDYGE